jgi:hypothetical protein
MSPFFFSPHQILNTSSDHGNFRGTRSNHGNVVGDGVEMDEAGSSTHPVLMQHTYKLYINMYSEIYQLN